ncbi:MAG TPA: SRPBCC family protein [Anaerolineales bacterium]|nr:SRPBCC family protein [Anaerolineales bacterium]
MISFDLNTLIYRPLTQVFAFVATPENDFQWQYGTLASTQISAGTVGLGTLFHVVGHVMGLRIESTYEVTVFEPNKRYGFKSVSGPVASHTLYTFATTEAATKISLSTEANPGDLFKPNNAIVVKRFKKEYKENLAMLKSVLEAHRSV